MKSLRTKNRKQTHPGVILREDVLPTLKMNQSRIAKVLKVSRYAMSQIIHERRLVTTDIGN